MKLWLLLTFSLIVQESATFTTTLYLSMQGHVSAWLIHLAFLCATSFDIWLGYHLGGYIDRKFLHNSCFQRWVKKHSAFINKPGFEWILILTGLIDFPFLNGVIGSWVELPFRLVFVTTLIGDSIGYILLWAIALGVFNLNFNSYISFTVLIVLAITAAYLLERFFEKKTIKK